MGELESWAGWTSVPCCGQCTKNKRTDLVAYAAAAHRIER
jgi:hypothetical protein